MKDVFLTSVPLGGFPVTNQERQKGHELVCHSCNGERIAGVDSRGEAAAQQA